MLTFIQDLNGKMSITIATDAARREIPTERYERLEAANAKFSVDFKFRE